LKLKPEHLPYLTGESFSTGLHTAFDTSAEDRQFRSRIHWLSQICAGKRIVHLGCVDHDIQTIDRKRARGKWLHAILDDVAEDCYGVDLNAEGIDYIRGLGYQRVNAIDILAEEDPEITGGQWDYLVLAEVLEHIENPAGFLRAIAEKYAGRFKKLIITVPNAFSWQNHKATKRGVEIINTDHRFWFTPFTIAKNIAMAGLLPDEIIMCGYKRNRSPLKRWRFGRYPLLRDNIIATATWKDGEN